MALFKEKPVYVFRKGKYYDVNSSEVREDLTKKEKEKSTIINLPETKQHLTKYDKKSKYHFQVAKGNEEFGISTGEVDVLYLIDYMYLLNNLEYKNVLLRTKNFSVVLINNITVDFIEHSEEEGEDLQFFSMLFNGNEFVHADLWGLYNKIVNDKSENNVISIVFFLLMGVGLYYGFFAEDEEEDLMFEEESYIIEGNAVKNKFLRDLKQKQYKLETPRQKELLKYYRQRTFINELIDYAQTKKVKNMFRMITDVKMDNKNEKYSMTFYSLLPDVGFKRKGKMFVNTVSFNKYEKDKVYKNTINKDITENEADYVDFFLDNTKIKENIYTKRAKEYLVKNEFEYRLDDLKLLLDGEETNLSVDYITNQKKIDFLKMQYLFVIEEMTPETSVLGASRIIEADQIFSLLRYLRDMNVLVDKLSISKVKKTINSTMFKVKCKITIKNKG